MLVNPHGHSELKPLLAPEEERASSLARAKKLHAVPMTSREISDLLMFGMGAYTPLTGFMGEESWKKCCTEFSTADGLFWPIPITLSASGETASKISVGDSVSLTDKKGERDQ